MPLPRQLATPRSIGCLPRRQTTFAALLPAVAFIVPCAGQCERWLPGHGLPGVWPSALTVCRWDPDGGGPKGEWLVVGGNMAIAGGKIAQKIAAWDGQAWHTWPAFGTWPLSLNVADYQHVRALEVFQGDLIAAGHLTSAAGLPVKNIARWDGASWHALGGGLHGPQPVHIYALQVYQGDLIAAGKFAKAGSIVANSIAAWDGSAWRPLGAGTPGWLGALGLHNGDLIAGGGFDKIGVKFTRNIARWDGSTWRALGPGISDRTVVSLASHEGDLFAGTVQGVMRWNGTQWHASPGIGGTVYALDVCAGDLYASTDADAFSSNCARRLTPEGWTDAGNDLAGIAFGFSEFRGEVVAAGWFDPQTSWLTPGRADGVVVLRGDRWRSLSPGVTQNVLAIRPFKGQLVAAGSFVNAGGSPIEHIARWDGLIWRPLGQGVDGPVHSLFEHEGQLIAGGGFENAGGQAARSIARWNGAAWSPVGNGLWGPVLDLAVYREELIAGGEFTVGSSPAGRIARWDGAAWRTLGSGMNGAGNQQWTSVAALALYGGDLIAAGTFHTAGGQPASNIARWDGESWHPLGSGVEGNYQPVVMDLIVYRDDLYASGHIHTAGGESAVNTVRWNGTQWHRFGRGYAPSLAVYRGDLVFGGWWTPDDRPSISMARWNGETVSGLGTGISFGYTESMAPFKGELVVGGDMLMAGGKISARFARWTDSGIPWVARQPKHRTAQVGGPATFTARPASGYGNVSYVWRRSGVTLANGPGGASAGGGVVSGVGTPTITIIGVRPSDAGAYKCYIVNSCGSVASKPASLTVFGCYADCNADGVLSLGADFGCFQARYQQGEAYADCNADGAFTVADITCFKDALIAGCP